MPRTTVHVAAEADCAWHPWLLSAFVDTFGTLHLAAECVPMFCAWLHSHWFRRKRKGRRLAIPAVLITKTCLQLQLWHVYFTLQDWLLCGFCNCATIGTMQVCIKNGDPIMGVLKEGCPRDTADTTSRSFFAHTRVEDACVSTWLFMLIVASGTLEEWSCNFNKSKRWWYVSLASGAYVLKLLQRTHIEILIHI